MKASGLILHFFMSPFPNASCVRQMRSMSLICSWAKESAASIRDTAYNRCGVREKNCECSIFTCQTNKQTNKQTSYLWFFTVQSLTGGGISHFRRCGLGGVNFISPWQWPSGRYFMRRSKLQQYSSRWPTIGASALWVLGRGIGEGWAHVRPLEKLCTLSYRKLWWNNAPPLPKNKHERRTHQLCSAFTPI